MSPTYQPLPASAASRVGFISIRRATCPNSATRRQDMVWHKCMNTMRTRDVCDEKHKAHILPCWFWRQSRQTDKHTQRKWHRIGDLGCWYKFICVTCKPGHFLDVALTFEVAMSIINLVILMYFGQLHMINHCHFPATTTCHGKTLMQSTTCKLYAWPLPCAMVLLIVYK